MFCYECGKEHSELGLCPDCKERKGIGGLSDSCSNPVSRRQTLQTFDNLLFRYFGFILPVVVVVVALVFAFRSTYLDWEGLVAPENVSQCRAKSNCVIAYVTSWCPACKSSVGNIQALQQRYRGDPRFAFAVVIGDHNQGQAMEFARIVGGYTVLDQQQNLARILGIRSYPTYLVVGSDGAVKFRDHYIDSAAIEDSVS